MTSKQTAQQQTHRARWHHLHATEIAGLLGVDPRAGLSSTEVERRQRQHGPNRLSEARRAGPLRRFLQQFRQPLMYILAIAAAITMALGEIVDGAVIFGVVLINAAVGFLQEARAERAIDALARMVVTEATVRRDGRRQRVPSEQLVPGDVVLVQAGDKVPADLRLFWVRGLRVDESALSGESVPVEKHPDPLAPDTILAERRNLAFAGTVAVHGQAEGVVWAIGDETETGHIAHLIDRADDLSTPLTRKIAEFSRLLLFAILGLALLTFAIGLWRGQRPFDMFMAAVALSVGAIPEGLPAAVTITLAVGVSRMARRRAIIRKLPAVETLGSTTVICSDKTGTLTENQMTVQAIYAGGEVFTVTGAGYEPRGEIRRGEDAVAAQVLPALRECLLAGLLNNDAQLRREGDAYAVEGDPTEAALLVAAHKAGLVPADLHEAHPRLDIIPFESEHQFMATLHGRGEGRPRVIYKKGSIERVLSRCDDALGPDGRPVPLDREAARRAAEEMAAQGLRVLALARREVPQEHERLQHEHVGGGLTFLGLQGMIDPPRPEAIAAVRTCQEAGVQVKMITGDHLLTAKAVARKLGLRGARDAGTGDDAGQALSGRELEQIGDAELGPVAEEASVFARVAPEQKLRLVRALQGRGHIVAMTGDGVNDAPALRQADIGVAMGRAGTDVAKGAADMILTDDNFASIEAAVEEGRGVFDNLTKFIVWTIPTNAGEALILVTAIFAGTPLPALPLHLLWVNMTTAVLLGLMLVFEPRERGIMRRPPRDPRRPILRLPLIMRSGLVTLLLLIAAFGLFYYEMHAEGASLAQARSIVVNVIVVGEAFYLISCRSLIHAPWSVGFFSNPFIFAGIGATIAAQLLFTHVSTMNRLFHTEALTPSAWLHVLLSGLAIFIAVEIEKAVRRRLAAAEE